MVRVDDQARLEGRRRRVPGADADGAGVQGAGLDQVAEADADGRVARHERERRQVTLDALDQDRAEVLVQAVEGAGVGRGALGVQDRDRGLLGDRVDVQLVVDAVGADVFADEVVAVLEGAVEVVHVDEASPEHLLDEHLGGLATLVVLGEPRGAVGVRVLGADGAAGGPTGGATAAGGQAEGQDGRERDAAQGATDHTGGGRRRQGVGHDLRAVWGGGEPVRLVDPGRGPGPAGGAGRSDGTRAAAAGGHRRGFGH